MTSVISSRYSANLIKMITIAVVVVGVLGVIDGKSEAEFSDRWVEGYERLLKRYIKPGLHKGIAASLIDYKGLREDMQFRKVRRGLAKLPSFSSLNPKKELALWVNIYNFLVLSLVVEHPGLNSLLEIKKGRKSVWYFPAGKVSGKTYTLHEIDRGIMRRKFKDPRVHFALSKGAISSPDLRMEAYQGKLLNAQFADQISSFFENGKKGKRFGEENGKRTVYLSVVFSWFGRDFDNKPREWMLKNKLLTVDESRYRLQYMRYNFTLNAQPERS